MISSDCSCQETYLYKFKHYTLCWFVAERPYYSVPVVCIKLLHQHHTTNTGERPAAMGSNGLGWEELRSREGPGEIDGRERGGG
jgi:hypothetical protein